MKVLFPSKYNLTGQWGCPVLFLQSEIDKNRTLMQMRPLI